MKIVILLRDPVKRAYSAWNMYKSFKGKEILPEIFSSGYLEGQPNNLNKEFYSQSEFPSFQDVVLEDIKKYEDESPLEEPGIVRRGIYYEQVKRYYDLFGRQNVCIIGFKDLIGNQMVKQLNQVLELIGLPEDDWAYLKKEPRNVGGYKAPFPEEVKPILDNFYATHNEKLFQLLGYKPNW